MRVIQWVRWNAATLAAMLGAVLVGLYATHGWMVMFSMERRMLAGTLAVIWWGGVAVGSKMNPASKMSRRQD